MQRLYLVPRVSISFLVVHERALIGERVLIRERALFPFLSFKLSECAVTANDEIKQILLLINSRTVRGTDNHNIQYFHNFIVS